MRPAAPTTPVNNAPTLPLELPAWAAACGFAHASARVEGALHLCAEELEAQVEALYGRMLRDMHKTATPHAVRFWNGLPHILETITPPADENAAWEKATPVHEKFDRYMAFNAGRARAMLAHYGSREALAAAVPAGTGVGHGGADLVVHGLFAATAGTPVENPRQTPAFRYSPRFGPLPPCFARATRVDMNGRPTLLVSGTASVVGEETWHAGCWEAQAEETVRNLNALLEAAGFGLAHLRDTRLYVTHARDLPAAGDWFRRRLPQARVETVHAEICRPGLLLEIEGFAA